MPLLAIEHISKTHFVGPYEKRVLVDVSLSVEAGDFFGIWGGHRSGKSTLVRVAAGLESPDAGRVVFGGQDLSRLSKRGRDMLRLSDIGVVLGVGPKGARTVLDYVTIPLLGSHRRRDARRAALAVLGRLDVIECRDARWDQLSDSEKLLVDLAHGLVRRPRLLLVDHQGAGMDPLQQQEVVQQLRSFAGTDGVAVLFVSGNLSAVTEANAVYTLSDGRLTAVKEPGGKVIKMPRGGDRQTGS